ncbi:MAG: glycosyltransferase family 2 protein [Betaproteobacteria bacterium]
MVPEMIANPAPICLFAYKRPLHLIKTIEALRRNPLASRSHLVIYSDGAKRAEDAAAVREVRSICHEVSGFASVKLIEQEGNLGLARSVIGGVTEMCDTFGRVIVLEDDLIVSPHFLDFMNTALTLYEADEKVFSIHGYVFPVHNPLPETFFLLGADCWGWATWSRAWRHFEADGRRLLKGLSRANLRRRFDFDGAYDYSGMLQQQIDGRVDSWAIRWQASALLEGGLTLYPGRSLVRNIGFDETGTHSSKTAAFDVEVSDTRVQVMRIPLIENEVALAEFADYYRGLKPKGFKGVALRLKRVVRRFL